MRRLACTIALSLLALAAPASATKGSTPLAGDAARAGRARDAIVELDVTKGRTILDGADPGDGALAVERARLAIYEGDYDAAAQILGRPDLSSTQEGADLGEIARGCSRAMAAALVIRDDERGVIVRLQDDEDRALAPLLADVAVRVRAMLVKDLGVELPKPLHVDLVRDQFSLAAMTGLPEEAARTTGTVAVAKWGRVTMISPRATERGYPWLDTLAHEMTHLALSRGTRDKAPLWLQEGVAKREETRWRDPEPLDDVPSIDVVAASGIAKGLGRPIDKLGPSIAMLPSAEEAQVVFAEVQSFVRFFIREVGDDALVKLTARLLANDGPESLAKSIVDVSGTDFAAWDKKWHTHLAQVPRDLPPDLAPGAEFPHAHDVGRRMRLGELLHGRSHEAAAAIEYQQAHGFAPFDASIRAFLGEALVASGERDKGAELVKSTDDVHGKFGRWWTLHAAWQAEGDDAALAFRIGIALDPLDPHVGCEEKAAPELPSNPLTAAICEAARRVPVEDP